MPGNRKNACPRCPGLKHAHAELCAACRAVERRAQAARSVAALGKTAQTTLDAERAATLARAARLDGKEDERKQRQHEIHRAMALKWGILAKGAA